ncbi:hypothetical protein IJ732_07195 [bacterium]|nr:hypothetical protein [bacterium]
MQIKKIILFFVILILSLGLTACKKEIKSLILFNHYPITSKNVLDNSTLFKTDERIYFVYMTKKNLQTPDIRIKIYKLTEHNDFNSYGDMIYSNDFRLKKGEINYFTDYIVMHSAGSYRMHVYKKDYLWKPDAIADFKVVGR